MLKVNKKKISFYSLFKNIALYIVFYSIFQKNQHYI